MNLKYELRNGWKVINEMNNIDAVMKYSDEYMDFLNKGKTERKCVKEIEKMAIEKGFKSILDIEKVSPGDKIYAINKDKNIALFIIGKQDIEKGLRIIGSHIDSPRLDLKPNPLYEDSELSLMETHYYGGVKKYQWVTIPLALHGVVVKKDGTKIDVVVGEEETDPVVMVSDLLVHLASEQQQKKATEVIAGEDLNILVGSMPLEGEEKEAVKANILKLLKEKYDFEEEDFMSAEIEIVPAGKARDLGLDRSMVAGYGHDDRICAYTSLLALLETESVKKTSVVLLVDKEEVGSIGATGMQSRFFENAVAELMDRVGEYSELKLRRALANSKMLSSDVTAAFDPNYAGAYEKKNSAFFGKGLAFAKYTGARGKSGCNDANAEFVAWLRNVMDESDVSYQMAELGKVDQGGGGTIAYILAEYGMEVIDCGVALQNMHAPWEVASKVDIYETMRGYKAFLIAE